MTYLSKEEAAIVSNVKCDSIDIYMPRGAEDENMPRCMRFMTACAMRYQHDPVFVDEMLIWLDAGIQKANGGLQ